MVVRFNTPYVGSDNSYQERINKLSPCKNISDRKNSEALTLTNKQFLISIGLKLKKK